MNVEGNMRDAHTPGPWWTEGGLPVLCGGEGGPFQVASAHILAGEGYANARLIAAAPDLLAALREIAEIAGTNAGAMQTHFDPAKKAHFGQTLGERKVIASDFIRIASAARAALAKAGA